VLDSKNIIVVEDDLDIRELISFNLANEGHQVFESNN
jgi:DNA-binding response OmpR family regulator